MKLATFKTAVAALSLASVMTLNAAQAQTTENNRVVLVADSVFLRGSNLLTATGNVEAIYGETRMTASKITYDGQTDKISVEGPIEISAPDGVQVFARFAELDADLQNGLIESARLVLNEQVQIGAQQLRRIDGHTSQLLRATATSCKTCADGEPPLWQIRARRVTHDQNERQLYFDDAQFRLFDVPIFYLPRLRLPDPTAERATGFLIPSIRARSRIGTGIKVPYFIAMGDHRDLTITPYLATGTRTVELRYRQAFQTGEILFTGAVSDDDLTTRGTRAYVFGEGAFDLAGDYKLTFNLQQVSDSAYLADYDYSDLDRLRSDIKISRVNRNENTQYALIKYDSVRTGEDNQTIPSWVISARKQKRFEPRALGGDALWELEAHSHYRPSGADVIGRDVSRVNAEVDWQRTWILPQGLVLGAQANIALDVVETSQDSTLSDSSYVELTPAGAVNLRYPLIRAGKNGSTSILEPLVQLGWSGGSLRAGTPDQISNDESSRVEFDEGNLLALSRFASDDRRERGMVGAWGLNWSRIGPDWSSYLTLGQVVRDEVHPDFSESSGLSKMESDYLLAAKFENALGLEFSARTLFDGLASLNKAEARGGWNNTNLSLDATYIWLNADSDEDRAVDLSEWNFDSAYRFNRHWTGLANWRYDVASGSTAEAGLGVEYRNECIKSKFEVSRRFTSSTTVQPATDYSFTVEILGFSTNTIDKSYARTCAKTAG